MNERYDDSPRGSPKNGRHGRRGRSRVVIALDAESAAASVQMPYTTFQDKVKGGEIAYAKIGGGLHREHRRFLPEDLRAWLLRNRVAARWEGEAISEEAEADS